MVSFCALIFPECPLLCCSSFSNQVIVVFILIEPIPSVHTLRLNQRHQSAKSALNCWTEKYIHNSSVKHRKLTHYDSHMNRYKNCQAICKVYTNWSVWIPQKKVVPAWGLHSQCGQRIDYGICAFLARYSENFKSVAMSGDHEAGKGVGAIVVQQPRCPTTQHLHWTGPALGSIKLNYVASYLEQKGEYSASAVARDSRGHVVISICQNTSPQSKSSPYGVACNEKNSALQQNSGDLKICY